MLKRLWLVLLAVALPSLLGRSETVVSAAALPTAPTEADGWRGLPDLDANSGRFLSVSGDKNFTIAGDPFALARNIVRLTFDPAVSPDVKIAAFDADSRGRWDQRVDGAFVLAQPDTIFEIYADPDGSVATWLLNPLLPQPPGLVNLANPFSALSAELANPANDATWRMLYTAPIISPGHANAFAASDGRYHFVIATTLKANNPGTPLSGYEINGYKLAFNGTYLLPKDSVLGLTCGVIDGLVVLVPGPDGNTQLLVSNDPFPDILPLGANDDIVNSYDGTIEFPFSPSVTCEDLEIFEGDADWNRVLLPGEDFDPDPTGVPPDNGIRYLNPQPPAGMRDARLFAISGQIGTRTVDSVGFAIVAPNGTVVKSDLDSNIGHASVTDISNLNGPFKPFTKTIVPQADLRANPGLWKFRWVGLDAHNSVFIKFNTDFGSTPRVQTVRGRLYCDGNGNSAFDQGETPLAGVQVKFTLVGAVPADVRNATTAADGTFSIKLPAGAWDADLTTALCATSKKTLPLRFTVTGCENETVLDLPFECTNKASGHVFCDTNGNNVFDVGDLPLSGNVGVRLERVGPGDVVLETVNVVSTGVDWSASGLTLGSWRAFVPTGQAVTDPLTKTSAQPQTFTLDAQNCSRTGLDFGYVCNTPLCFRLFCDPDMDCRFAAGDVPIFPVDVTITLLPIGVPITRATDATGRVCFDVGPGTYSVTVGGLPVAYANATLRNGPIPPVVLGQQAVDVSLCYDCPNPGRIFGKVFKEKCINICDGKFDGNSIPIAGVLVGLVGTNPVRPPAVDVTDANGDYEFNNLLPGVYAVSVNGADPLLVNLTPTGAINVPATILGGDQIEINFPMCECPRARVYGYVYRNPPCTCDEAFNDGDSPIPGVEVKLTGVVNGGLVALATTTDASGFYEFNELQPGQYTVEVDGQQPVLVNLTPGTPTVVGPFTLAGGEEKRVDFGFCTARLCGTLWRLPPCSCEGAPSENDRQPLAGVLVHLLQTVGPAVGLTLETTTGQDGGYCFEELAPGSYEVSIPDQAVLDGLTADGPTTVTVNVDVRECRFDVDFRFTPPGTQRICAKVFLEPEGYCDGKFDESRDKWAQWIEVFLGVEGDNDGYLASGFTDEHGRICFDNLAPGKYVVYVGSHQPALSAYKPSTPNCYRVCLGPCQQACAPFGWCKTCVPTPCCDGDLNEVLVGTAFWLGDCVRDLNLKVRLFRGCDCNREQREIDSVCLNWRNAFPGETRGLNDVISVVDVKVKNGVVYVVLRIRASGQWFTNDAFGRGDYRLETTFNGRTNLACAKLRCESFRAGMLFQWDSRCPKIPPCEGGWRWDGKECWDAPWLKAGCKIDARYLVLDTKSKETRDCQKCTTCSSECSNCPHCTELLPTRCGQMDCGCGCGSTRQP